MTDPLHTAPCTLPPAQPHSQTSSQVSWSGGSDLWVYEARFHDTVLEVHGEKLGSILGYDERHDALGSSLHTTDQLSEQLFILL